MLYPVFGGTPMHLRPRPLQRSRWLGGKAEKSVLKKRISASPLQAACRPPAGSLISPEAEAYEPRGVWGCPRGGHHWPKTNLERRARAAGQGFALHQVKCIWGCI